MKDRNVSLDGLRAIGLLAIIFAHVGPNEWLFQLRNFDVPLMVLVSGAVFNLSSGSTKSYLPYFKSRVGRLAIPTWIFLAFFFSFVYLFTKLFHQRFPYSMNTLLSSFELSDGTGYVWIIRVFILVAIALPIFIKIHSKFPKAYLHILFWTYLLYELAFYTYSRTSFIQQFPLFNYFVKYIVFYIVPYGIIAGFGFYVTKMKNSTIALLSLIFGLIFVSLAINLSTLGFTPTQSFKYPPQIYYLSYALFVSLLLYLFSKTEVFKKIFANETLLFISRSSLWIFLWQILYLFIWNELKIKNFILEYIFVLFFSVITTYLQKILFSKLVANLSSKGVKNFLSVAFLK